jgi:hypothetical protein
MRPSAPAPISFRLTNWLHADPLWKPTSATGEFARAVALAGPTAPTARTQLERLYNQKNNSLDGLDALIAQKRSELGE